MLMKLTKGRLLHLFLIMEILSILISTVKMHKNNHLNVILKFMHFYCYLLHSYFAGKSYERFEKRLFEHFWHLIGEVTNFPIEKNAFSFLHVKALPWRVFLVLVSSQFLSVFIYVFTNISDERSSDLTWSQICFYSCTYLNIFMDYWGIRIEEQSNSVITNSRKYKRSKIFTHFCLKSFRTAYIFTVITKKWSLL